jgi:hypothetical protein
MHETTDDCNARIARILELTRAAKERARAGDWGSAVAIEAERRPLIRSFFAQPLPGDARGRVATAIREILASDAGLIALAAAGRSAAAAESTKLRHGRRAAAAYAANGTRGAQALPRTGKELPFGRDALPEVVDLS